MSLSAPKKKRYHLAWYLQLISLSANKIVFFSAAVLFRLMLDASYYLVISVAFASDGYAFDFSMSHLLWSWIIYLVAFAFVGDRLFKVSDYFFATALLAVTAPLTSLYGLDSARPVLPVLIVVISVFFIYLITRLKLISFQGMLLVKNGKGISIGISLLFVAFLVVWYSVSGARFNLDLSKVYDVRAENAELAAGGLLAYTNNWTYQIFNIFLMAVALLYKRYISFAILFIVQVYFFAASAHKSILFLPFLIIGVWFYFRKTSSLAVLPIMFTGVIIATLLSYFIFDDLWLSSLFSRRVFYVPADLTFVYFEFFADNPKIFWSNSVLSGFFTYPYDLSLAHVVGRYLGKEGMGANNGFIASGYAHAGLFGVFVYALIVGFILRFINDITYKTLPVWLAVALSIVPLRTLLISSDLFTVMLTHGFIVAIFLIFLARSKHA